MRTSQYVQYNCDVTLCLVVRGQWFPSPSVHEHVLHGNRYHTLLARIESWDDYLKSVTHIHYGVWSIHFSICLCICICICIYPATLFWPSGGEVTPCLRVHTQCFETLPCGSRKLQEYVIFADQCKFKMELLLLYSSNLKLVFNLLRSRMWMTLVRHNHIRTQYVCHLVYVPTLVNFVNLRNFSYVCTASR